MAIIYQTTRGFGVDYRDAYGQRHRLHVGSEPAARVLAARLEEESRSGRSALKAMGQGGSITFSEAVSAYLNARACAASTKETERLRLCRVARRLASVQLAQISPELMRDYLAVRQGEVSPGSAYAETCLLHRLFEWLKERWFLPANPVPRQAMPPPRTTPAYALTLDQETVIHNACGETTWLRILLALDAGLRYSEVVQLRRQHVDTEQQTLTIYSRKTRTMRTVPMTTRLAALVLRRCQMLQDAEAHLVQWGGGPIHAKSAFMKGLRKRVGFHFRFHDLRHTFATRLSSVSQRQRIVMTALGHAPRTTTDLYDHPSLDELREAVQSMQRKFRPQADLHAPPGRQP